MHTAEEKEDNSFKGKVVAFFDIEKDPLVQSFKKKTEPEEEKNNDWVFSR
jgi:hypothetical protein